MSWPEISITVLQIVILIGVLAFGIRERSDKHREWKLRDDWLRLHGYRDRYFGYPLEELILNAERQSDVRLTWGAREMLRIPVIEAIEAQGDVDWAQVDVSIRDIVGSMSESQAERGQPSMFRDSRSVIRAFFKRFCNIPPFCSRTDE